MNMREGKDRKPIHLAAHFPGVNNTTVWTDPSAGSQIDFDSFVHLARTAERGLFDFFFLAEGLRLREHRGQIHDLDVVGRPDTFTVLAALAGVTDRIGLTGTINTTFNEPFEVARQFATLDHLSGGRAGWNIVTSSDAFTGANFRRGGFLDYADRYARAEEFRDGGARNSGIAGTPTPCWPTWMPGSMSIPDRIRSVDHAGSQFGVRGFATLPSGPQGHPVLLQAGDSAEGRDFGARNADALFTLHWSLEDGRRYYADVKGRAMSYGRDPDQLKVFPASTFVIGDTDGGGRGQGATHPPSTGQRGNGDRDARAGWGRELSDYDPDGPLPDFDPVVRQQNHPGPGAPRRSGRGCPRWRERAEAENLSIRELIIAVTSRRAVRRYRRAHRRRRSTTTFRPTPATASSWCRT